MNNKLWGRIKSLISQTIFHFVRSRYNVSHLSKLEFSEKLFLLLIFSLSRLSLISEENLLQKIISQDQERESAYMEHKKDVNGFFSFSLHIFTVQWKTKSFPPALVLFPSSTYAVVFSNSTESDRVEKKLWSQKRSQVVIKRVLKVRKLGSVFLYIFNLKANFVIIILLIRITLDWSTLRHRAFIILCSRAINLGR